MELRSVASYASRLKAALPKRAFQPARSRLLWLPFHLTVIALCAFAVTQQLLPGAAAFIAVPLIGFSFAGITFLAHETLHGAVVRSKWGRTVIGFVGFLPFMVSPRLWVRWHNQIHHGNANRPSADPDSFPTLTEYQSNRQQRWVVDLFSVGRKRAWGILTLLVGFSFHSAHILISSRKRGMLSATEYRMALLETALGGLFWAFLLVWLGPLSFLFVYVFPLMIANSIVMAYILTNHSLSPQTPRNDPLINSLSVTVPRFVDWITLHFGYHVEHHLFPSMSTRHAPTVRELIRRYWPERYQSMPLWRALQRLHGTARVYKDDTTLIDPISGKQWPALLPR
ncbi:MAG TPA: acyl-CoA desaturase [Polyangiaceae bacterium]|nr:acyl-CoA desaturase [Polyangiaceae bacterium]